MSSLWAVFLAVFSVFIGSQCHLFEVKIKRVTEEEDKESSTDTCFPSNPIRQLNFQSGAWMNIFLNMRFQCHDKVEAWEFYAKASGTFIVAVWRPYNGAGQFLGQFMARLVGRNRISVTQLGRQVVKISQRQQITAQPGDVLGLQYPASADDVTGGIVPYEDSRTTPLCCGLTYADMSDVHNSAERDEDILLGESIVLSALEGIRRVPAIVAHMAATTIGPPGSRACGTPEIKPSTTDKIVGGKPAIRNSWPWQVSLQTSSGRHFCGGSLISSQWVVTAAHCLPPWRGTSSRDRRVVLGMHYRNGESTDYVTSAAELIPDTNYNRQTHDNDIALLRLAEAVPFREEISPVCLPRTGQIVPDGTNCFTTGWGTTTYFLLAAGVGSSVLQQVRVPLISRETCNQPGWYDGDITHNMLCAGYEQGGRDSCQGDSGGPLVCFQDGRWVLAGVVSWGHGCAYAHKPGIYTNVVNYGDWLQNHMDNAS